MQLNEARIELQKLRKQCKDWEAAARTAATRTLELQKIVYADLEQLAQKAGRIEQGNALLQRANAAVIAATADLSRKGIRCCI